VTEASRVESGLRIETFVVQQPGPIFRLTRWPAVPENVRAPFWPGTVVVTLVGDPNAIVPVTSAGTSKREIVIDPVAAACGSTRIVYVPAAESRVVSRNPPIVPKVIGPTSVDAFGFRIVIRVLQHVGPTRSVMRWPAAAVNVTVAFCPGTDVVMVVDEPKATVPVTSAGTLNARTETSPVAPP
jgi:hypothetical protein